MGSQAHAVDVLFSALDRSAGKPPIVAQTLLERILYLDPDSSRAKDLLDNLERPTAERDPLEVAMEQVEALVEADRHAEALVAAAEVNERFGDDPAAQVWLQGLHVLYSSLDWYNAFLE